MYEQHQSPIIVQGTVVPNSNFNQQYKTTNQMESGYGSYTDSNPKGEVQPKQFNDVGFAIAFLAHIVFVIGFMVFVPASAANNNNEGGEDMSDVDYTGAISLMGTCAVFGVFLTTFMLSFMMKFAKQLVKIALIFSIGMSGVLALLGLMFGQILMACLGLLQFAVGICYAYYVWSRIPFAAANLNTSLTAVRSNMGLTLIAYFCAALAMVWTVRWMISANVAFAYFGEGAMFFLFLSFYWVHQVIQNTVHVTTAGVVGTWWFNPLEASSFCSSAITDSFTRSITYSFGSVCFGSLLVAIVQALRAVNRQARGQDDCQILVCITDCILGCIEGILEYLNKWAYIYVGLYGYGYVDAGRNVMTLFQHKGWEVIITDNLVDNVLLMVSLVIGLATGLVGLIIANIDQNLVAGYGWDNVQAVGFIMGLIVGYVVGSILMSIVASATNTVIVCFAEAPNEFQNNHPQLSNEMRETWRATWPNLV